MFETPEINLRSFKVSTPESAEVAAGQLTAIIDNPTKYILRKIDVETSLTGDCSLVIEWSALKRVKERPRLKYKAEVQVFSMGNRNDAEEVSNILTNATKDQGRILKRKRWSTKEGALLLVMIWVKRLR